MAFPISLTLPPRNILAAESIGRHGRMQHLFPPSAQDVVVCRAHLLRGYGVGHCADAGTEARYSQGTYGAVTLRIVLEYRDQRRTHGKVGIQGIGNVGRNPHRWRCDYERQARCRHRNHQGHSNRQLTEELFSNTLNDRPLCRAMVEVIDALIDASTHVSKAVRGGDDCIRIGFEQVTLEDLHGLYAEETFKPGIRHFRVDITQAKPQWAGRSTFAERLYDLHMPPF